jgi:hypothetical protein
MPLEAPVINQILFLIWIFITSQMMPQTRSQALDWNNRMLA